MIVLSFDGIEHVCHGDAAMMIRFRNDQIQCTKPYGFGQDTVRTVRTLDTESAVCTQAARLQEIFIS